MRRFGAAEARQDPDAEALRKELVVRASAARKELGNDPLLALRAAQTALFEKAVSDFAASGRAGTDLTELGGTFGRSAEKHGWIRRGMVALDPGELRCLYLVRWTRLAGFVGTHPLSPTLNEWRLHFRAALRHGEARDPAQAAEARLAVVSALSKIDPDYPAALARGILERQRGNAVEAVRLLRQHLTTHPDGPWRLRAQNYLVEALRLVPPDPEEEEAEF
jgi:hypothetical protein